jgi:oligopeptide transport system substrate-binding protein
MLLLGSLLSIVVEACNGEAASAGTRYFGTTTPRHGPEEVWTNLMSEPEWIDPGKCSDNVGGTLIMNAFAGLTQTHPQTLQPMPDVASDWDVSADGRQYVFHLRPTCWSDGTPLTARDFEYSWKRVLARDTASKYAAFLYPLKNAEAYNQGKLADTEVGVRALDDLTLEVTLENPLPYFLDLTAYYTLAPVPRHVIERLLREGKNPDLWTRVDNIVSNGPFNLAEWTFRQHIVLEKNPRYWAADQVKLQRIRLSMVDSQNTVLNLYEAGELDHLGISQLPAEFLDHLKRYADFRSTPQLATYFYWFNTRAKPVDDPWVRRALSMAVDRASLVRYVTRGGQVPTADMVPDGLAGYAGLHTPIFDPEGARQSLTRAGYGPDHPMPPITLRYNTSEGHKQIAEAIQQMWKKNLGIDVQIENQEWKVYLNSVTGGDFQVARMGWIGDYPDPDTFLELLVTGNGNNHSNWSNERYDQYLRRANQTQNQGQRRALLRQAEALAIEEAPILPIYVSTRSELVKPYLMGYFANSQSRFLFRYWSIDQRWYDGVPTARLPDPPPPVPLLRQRDDAFPRSRAGSSAGALEVAP